MNPQVNSFLLALGALLLGLLGLLLMIAMVGLLLTETGQLLCSDWQRSKSVSDVHVVELPHDELAYSCMLMSSDYRVKMCRFLFAEHHHAMYREHSNLFGAEAHGEGVVFGNGNVVVQMGDDTYHYVSWEGFLKVRVGLGELIVKWLDEEQE